MKKRRREYRFIFTFIIAAISMIVSITYADSDLSWDNENTLSSWTKTDIDSGSYHRILEGYNSISICARQAIAFANRMCQKISESESISTMPQDETSMAESDLKLKLEELIAQELGKPYQWGGTGPDGYDCSGLVYSLYGKLGISLPRTAGAQAEAGTYVTQEELKYGDLVFFAADGERIDHVGIYIGGDEFVHSPKTGDVVKKSTLATDYFLKSYYTARRVIN